MSVVKWECSACNQPVDQPCCRLETAKLKAGLVPSRCPLSDATKPRWKRAPKAKESPATVKASTPVQQTHGARGKVAHIAALESYGNEMNWRGMRSEGEYYHELARQRRHA